MWYLLLGIATSFCFCSSLRSEYYSQCGQDKYLFENFFRSQQTGVFVDIGAHDGISFSNTKFFEDIGWTGICIEPIPEIFEKLKKQRKALCIQGCIADRSGKALFLRIKGAPEMCSGLLAHYDPRHLNRITREVNTFAPHSSYELIEVNCYLLNEILENNHIFHVDYLSIDTEGSELAILKSIDFLKFNIKIIDVENNFNENKMRDFLISKGYQFIGSLFWDDLFIKR